MKERQKEVHKAALAYYDLGYCVLPIPLGSKGLRSEWKQYQTERPSREQVKAWFSDGLDHNILIICGIVSGNLVVIDFDKNSEFLKFLEKNPNIKQQTPIIETGRSQSEGGPGHHIYLRAREPVDSFDIPGVMEVRSNKRYVLAPPSIHPKTGNTYQFINPEIREPIMIDSLKDIGIEAVRPKPRLVSSMRLLITPETIRPRYARESVPSGERNNQAFKVACYFFRHYRRELAEKRIIQWAHEFCENFPDESFTEKNLEVTIESAYKTVMGGKT